MTVARPIFFGRGARDDAAFATRVALSGTVAALDDTIPAALSSAFGLRMISLKVCDVPNAARRRVIAVEECEVYVVRDGLPRR